MSIPTWLLSGGAVALLGELVFAALVAFIAFNAPKLDIGKEESSSSSSSSVINEMTDATLGRSGAQSDPIDLGSVDKESMDGFSNNPY
jgi:hypothetical protein